MEEIGNGFKYPGGELSIPNMKKIERLVKSEATIDHHVPVLTTKGLRDFNPLLMAMINPNDKAQEVALYLLDKFPGKDFKLQKKIVLEFIFIQVNKKIYQLITPP